MEITREYVLLHKKIKYWSCFQCSGKIVSWFLYWSTDSDDYLEPDAVELCLNEFKKIYPWHVFTQRTEMLIVKESDWKWL